MTTSQKPDTLTAITSVVKTSLPPSKPPETIGLTAKERNELNQIREREMARKLEELELD